MLLVDIFQMLYNTRQLTGKTLKPRRNFLITKNKHITYHNIWGLRIPTKRMKPLVIDTVLFIINVFIFTTVRMNMEIVGKRIEDAEESEMEEDLLW